MEFSAQPSWTDHFPTGYFQQSQAKPLYKKVTEHELSKQRIAYFLSKGNNTGFDIRLNPKGPPPPITKPDSTSLEGFTNPPNFTPLLLLFSLLLLFVVGKKIL